ncbi:hypothetical protein N780_01930 [Pontibacillus chungwhensis BH030062]|uniref:DUF3221 domain-containing protein n=1 Tax=Pontibacillus chungwhensis BH030062 TaxID=1385513 RepID=A0A0A2VFL7_9BACI|nr:YobA family protein [Pontibacillus chungwhensis]KGP92400.1 hypothetical protein N780_01930 [Pontibacillus chungwhensis BH030062]
MKRNLVTILIVVLFILGGCNQEDQDFTGPPTIEGHLVEIEDTQVLVVNGITKEQAISMSGDELLQSTDEKYEAHIFQRDSWFDDFSEYEVGQVVRVWGKGGANESYPPQSTLGEIEVVD